MTLSLIVPCYNESQSLEKFSQEVFGVLETINTHFASRDTMLHNKMSNKLSESRLDSQTHTITPLPPLDKNPPPINFELIFINDGSRDNTLEILNTLKKLSLQGGVNALLQGDISESRQDFEGIDTRNSPQAYISTTPNTTPNTIPLDESISANTTPYNLTPPPSNCTIKIIDFSRNFGKEAAMYAGLKECSGDCAVIMDADLQDPPSLLPTMFAKWHNNEADIIYARRTNRKGEGFIRSKLSQGFYTLSNHISEVKLESGVRDFRLLDRQVVHALLSMSEYHRFSKAMFEWVGFRKLGLEYENVPRVGGSSGWSMWKLFKYGIEGFISFSTMPLRVAFVLGLMMSLFSICYGLYAVIDTLIFNNAVRGWTSLVAMVVFIGGVQLIILGIIGEYIARIYEQVKKRPIYIKRSENE